MDGQDVLRTRHRFFESDVGGPRRSKAHSFVGSGAIFPLEYHCCASIHVDG